MFVDATAGTNVEMFRLRAAELIQEADEQRLLREVRKARKEQRGRKNADRSPRSHRLTFHHGNVTS
ncbi:hypothetical protein BIV57_04100 [Mangrovactinospora gilvigrisea]|uniref:Uncharacterized protein n=1 Tax=Mangrovactinospora gilvigrisea TaxID=1428644 RepID=A0A1J7CB41_9ACTN|nr:hypothetical protein [Mangrovactinospora gilvigrisea]OIV38736.1 hypothetical protein BIV57_04100 [Mangrovactinospora gilvigrisea]